jgi:FKBP-type peptidyl-prolyl cis-trans isomerase SlyD
MVYPAAMKLADGTLVTIEYVLRSGKGEIIERSQDGKPLSFTLGAPGLLPGLAKAMQGMQAGESRKGEIPAGQLVPREVAPVSSIPLAEFPAGTDPQVGARFQAGGPGGQPVLFEVLERGADSVKVQLLHVLHDEVVHYEVKLISIRALGVPPPAPIDVPDLTDLATEGS